MVQLLTSDAEFLRIVEGLTAVASAAAPATARMRPGRHDPDIEAPAADPAPIPATEPDPATEPAPAQPEREAEGDKPTV